MSKEEGGQHTPFFSGYRPQFYFRTTDVTGTASLLGERFEMCMPGDNVKVCVELITPSSPWTTVFASLFAKAAVPSDLAW